MKFRNYQVMNRLIKILFLFILISGCNKSGTGEGKDDSSETILTTKTLFSTAIQNEQGVVAIDSTGMTINNSFPGFTKISQGSIIVGEKFALAPFGFARKVISVSDNGTGKILATAPAFMTDIFLQADINYNGGFANINDTIHSGKPADDSYFEFQVDKILKDFDGNSGTDYDQIRLSGTAKFRISRTSFAWKKSKENTKVQSAKLAIEVEDLSAFNITVGTKAEDRWIYPGLSYILPIEFYVPTPFGVPLPVYLPTNISVAASGEISLDFGITATFKSNGKFVIGAEYKEGVWNNISGGTFAPALNINNSSIGFSGEIGFYPLDIKAEIYPYYQKNITASIGAKAGIKLKGAVNNQSLNTDVDLEASVEGGIDVDFADWMGIDANFLLNKVIAAKNLAHNVVPFVVPTNGLIAYYPLDGNASDLSGNNNNGTINGGISVTADRKNIAGKAFLFNGFDSYILIPPSSTLNSITAQSDATFTCWFKTDSWNNVGGHISKNNNGNDLHYRFLINETGTLLQVEQPYAYGNYPALAANRWYHFAAVKSGNTARFYLDGTLINETAMLNDHWASDFNTNLEIGRDAHGPVEYTRGAFDEIRIYNRALSQSEIQLMKNL